MKRSRGYFCKQSNALEEAEIKRINDVLTEYTFECHFGLNPRVYQYKTRWRLISKLLMKEESWNE